MWVETEKLRPAKAQNVLPWQCNEERKDDKKYGIKNLILMFQSSHIEVTILCLWGGSIQKYFFSILLRLLDREKQCTWESSSLFWMWFILGYNDKVYKVSSEWKPTHWCGKCVNDACVWARARESEMELLGAPCCSQHLPPSEAAAVTSAAAHWAPQALDKLKI